MQNDQPTRKSTDNPQVAQEKKKTSAEDSEKAFKAATRLSSDEAHNTHPDHPDEHHRREQISDVGETPVGTRH